ARNTWSTCPSRRLRRCPPITGDRPSEASGLSGKRSQPTTSSRRLRTATARPREVGPAQSPRPARPPPERTVYLPFHTPSGQPKSQTHPWPAQERSGFREATARTPPVKHARETTSAEDTRRIPTPAGARH